MVAQDDRTLAVSVTRDEARALAGAAEMEAAILRKHLRNAAALMDAAQSAAVTTEAESLERAARRLRDEVEFDIAKRRQEREDAEWPENMHAWAFGR